MNTLTCPLPIFQRLLRDLAEDRRRAAFARVGFHDAEAHREWLVREFTVSSAELSPVPTESVFRIGLADTPPSWPLADLLPEPAAPVGVGYLYIGDGPWRGHVWGGVSIDDAVEPLHGLVLVGAGMHRVRIPVRGDRAPEPDPAGWAPADVRDRWSRTIGALGAEPIWQRLVRLHIGLVGCGRTGSVVAMTLARLGVRLLTLIDPDIVEMHNLGEMDAVSEDDLGSAKAEALAEHIEALSPSRGLAPLPIVAPLTHPSALAAAKACDVLVCCADNDAARLATAILATLYHKVLVDVGTGIFFPAAPHPAPLPEREREGARGILAADRGREPLGGHQQPPPRTMGADLRLVVPGDGCLLCRGNLTAYAQAVDDLCNHRPPTSLGRDWGRQRAGSLRTLNQLAAALGVQMLQDLVAERLHASTWAHVEFDQADRLTVQYPAAPEPTAAAPCALCAKAGLGDKGLGWSRGSG